MRGQRLVAGIAALVGVIGHDIRNCNEVYAMDVVRAELTLCRVWGDQCVVCADDFVEGHLRVGRGSALALYGDIQKLLTASRNKSSGAKKNEQSIFHA